LKGGHTNKALLASLWLRHCPRVLHRRDGLGRRYDAGKLVVKICKGHGVDVFGRVFVAIRTYPIERRVLGIPEIAQGKPLEANEMIAEMRDGRAPLRCSPVIGEV
jgi:hypothetical protein